jgi:7-cyano-7-deazaguanine synthase
MIKAIVLHSGGLDSTVVLGLAFQKFTSKEIVSLGISYGQKHSRELEAAQKVCDIFRVKRMNVSLPIDIFRGAGSTLVDPDKPNPELTYEELAESVGPSPTYVPFRNATFLSIATALALKFDAENAKSAEFLGRAHADRPPVEIWYGAHAEDAHNWAYPDCTPEFNGAMMNSIYIGSYQRVRLLTPFQWSTKADIVNVGARLGLPLELTYSCYNGGELHCGVCPTCIGRKEAFRIAGREDPVQYEL